MKKFLVPAGILAAIATTASAQPSGSSVTLYGIADAGVAHVDNVGGSSRTSLDAGRLQSSRLGVRGREDLGGGLAAVFALEHGIALDTGSQASGATFWNRQAWVGLTSADYGTLTLGYQYTPIYDQLILLSPAVTFGGHAGAVDGVAAPTSAVGRFDNTLGGSRVANSIKYHSPRFNGFRGLAMVGFGEVAGSSKAGRTLSVGMGYDQGPLSAGLVYLQSECRDAGGCGATGAKNKVLAAGAGYTFKVARVSMVVTDQKNARNVKGVDGTAISVLGTVPLGQWSMSAGYSVLNDKSGNDWDVRQLNLGAQYTLSRRTTLYAFLSRQLVDNGGKAHMLMLDSSDSAQTQYGLGLRHVF